ncbi:hypothetical protein AA18889_0328 [Acetobacter senegalensis DSM 18889]|nr:hypothetical protein AA18889_0328 [Acetobacter senegalensis DSM 18889]
MQRYIVYRIVADGTQPAGYVVNAVLWDGKSSWVPPNGMAIIQNDTLNIGDTYTLAS